jgi:thiamine biosynthesis lipoprotein
VRRSTAVFLSVFVMIIALLIVYRRSLSLCSREYYMMGTIVKITLPVRHSDAASEAARIMCHIASQVNAFSSIGDIARINRSVKPVKVSTSTFQLLRAGLDLCKKTDGAFDITCGRLSEIWGFRDGKYRIPEDSEIERVLTGVNYRLIDLSEPFIVSGRTKNTRIDPGGIAKGFIVDRAVDFLAGKGIPYGIIDAGGDLRCWGVKSRKRPWIIGVQNPRRTDGIIGKLVIDRPAAIATSGDYQRFFIKNGKRYCHIMDPSSGRPADTVMSATVIGANAAETDAVATAVCVLGVEKGLELLRKNGMDGIIIDKGGRISATSGLSKIFIQEKDNAVLP